jgi:hypothetical protein
MPKLKAILIKAGVTSEEIIYRPDHGCFIAASGIRKLAALVPDDEATKLPRL